MNWTWSIRSGDGGMNGLEFTRALTAGDHRRVLVHAAPADAQVEVMADDGTVVAAGSAQRSGPYSPMTELTLDGREVHRREVWPAEQHIGLPVLLCGGEVGILLAWQDEDDHTWWRWSVEFSNHRDRPDDWAPPPQPSDP